jgi:hypothetical protein
MLLAGQPGVDEFQHRPMTDEMQYVSLVFVW